VVTGPAYRVATAAGLVAGSEPAGSRREPSGESLVDARRPRSASFLDPLVRRITRRRKGRFGTGDGRPIGE
jgi:hypothetical protein